MPKIAHSRKTTQTKAYMWRVDPGRSTNKYSGKIIRSLSKQKSRKI